MKRASVIFLVLLSSQLWAAPEVVVKGLFGGSALLEIDGRQRLLKVGKTSPEGVKLVFADSQRAKVEVDGQLRELQLSTRVAGSYSAAQAKPEVRVVRQAGTEHYFVSGRINGRAANMMIDTGAFAVAMSSRDADRLGIRYANGDPAQFNTAGGVTDGYTITLGSVSVGEVTVNNVLASVTVGDFPSIILLGGSFLNKVDYKVEGNVMYIKAKF